MIISKSLFKEYLNMPQLARWSKNEKEIYKMINDIRYAGIDGQAVGQEVEDAVLKSLSDKHISSVDTNNLGYRHRHANYHARTQEAMASNADVIYQPWFLVNNMYCKCDLLVKNESWMYDLREVKAKNSIRKKSKDAPLLNDLVADVSFQDYVLKRALGMMYSGKVYIVHLNKEYHKQWAIDLDQLLIREDVSEELMQPDLIEQIVNSVDNDIPLSKPELDIKHPYTGQDYLSYFGTPPVKDSIWKIPRIRSKLGSLYDAGKRMITDLDELDIESLRNSKGEETGLMTYLKLWNTSETVIDTPEIQKQLSSLSYPLYFYDYETISVPVPLFENTHSRQQVVVQYSCHQIDADGSVTHTQGLIDHGQTDNTALIDKLVTDLAWGNGTYIVRYDGFENSRNNEMWTIYPQHQEAFAKINENTFDLMKVFSTWNYFDRRFQGSSSIKKVLPVLTDISYEGLAIPNGAIASDILSKLAKWRLAPETLEQTTKNLLEYCKQDTWAMVRIWEEVKKKIDSN